MKPRILVVIVFAWLVGGAPRHAETHPPANEVCCTSMAPECLACMQRVSGITVQSHIPTACEPSELVPMLKRLVEMARYAAGSTLRDNGPLSSAGMPMYFPDTRSAEQRLEDDIRAHNQMVALRRTAIDAEKQRQDFLAEVEARIKACQP